MKEKILVIDDDPHILNYMEEHLSLNDFDVHAFQSPAEALEAIPEIEPRLVITDVKMDELTGDDVLNHILKNHPSIGIILITGFGNIPHSVRAIRKGAFDYITKPFTGKEFLSRVDQFFKNPKTPMEVETPGAEPAELREFQESAKDRDPANTATATAPQSKTLVGEHASIEKLLSVLPQIAPTNAPVMIQGESGTGKEVYANLIQQRSNRTDKPFVKINCANLPSELVESTLFGHVKGAFTGATEDKKGAFQEAEGGTLLLDEVTEIDINLQAKLLRVLQEKEFKRVGSQKVHQTNVRIMSTTNRNIGKAINDNVLRKDLFFRLNVFPVQIPPLRDRKEDIPALADYFCEKFAAEYSLPRKNVSEKLKEQLMRKSWSGNVRELENYIKRGVIMSGEEEELQLEHVENPMFQNADEDLAGEAIHDLPVLPIDEMELLMIKKALERTNGNQKEAAKLLNISDRTIRNKLKKIDFPE
jgi:DNA-binding NtrC family response regulator